MLVLRRKAGEWFVIGPNILVSVLEIRGNVVKLACEAPWSVPVHCEEISLLSQNPLVERATRPGQSPYFSEFA